MAFSIDDAWDNCGPVARAGNAAFGVYCRCGAWAARNSSDGFVPAEVALAYGSPELATKLVSVGLWEAVGGGWSMPHYLQRNESAEQVSARRTREAKRKADWRARQKSHGDKTRTGRGTTAGQDAGIRAPVTTPKGVTGRASATPATCPGFLDDGGGWCKRCSLPRQNKIHPAA
jgi:hypothetical protein